MRATLPGAESLRKKSRVDGEHATIPVLTYLNTPRGSQMKVKDHPHSFLYNMMRESGDSEKERTCVDVLICKRYVLVKNSFLFSIYL